MTSKAAHGGSLEENMWQAIFLGPTQKLSYTATPAASTVFSPLANIIRLFSTTDCHVAIGPTPTAGVTDAVLSAGVPECFCVNANDKVSVRRRTTNGELWITEGLGVANA